MAVFRNVMAVNICLRVKTSTLEDTFVSKPNYLQVEKVTSQRLHLLFWGKKSYKATDGEAITWRAIKYGVFSSLPTCLLWNPFLSRSIILTDCWSSGRTRSFISPTRLISPPGQRVLEGGLFPNQAKGRSPTWPLSGFLSMAAGHTDRLTPPDRLTFDLPERTHAQHNQIYKHANLKSKILSLSTKSLVWGLLNMQAGWQIIKLALALFFILPLWVWMEAWWRSSRLSAQAETWLSRWKQCSKSPW